MKPEDVQEELEALRKAYAELRDKTIDSFTTVYDRVRFLRKLVLLQAVSLCCIGLSQLLRVCS